MWYSSPTSFARFTHSPPPTATRTPAGPSAVSSSPPDGSARDKLLSDARVVTLLSYSSTPRRTATIRRQSEPSDSLSARCSAARSASCASSAARASSRASRTPPRHMPVVKKTRPGGMLTSLRVAPSGKSTHRRSAPASPPSLGVQHHAPPTARTAMLPSRLTKLGALVTASRRVASLAPSSGSATSAAGSSSSCTSTGSSSRAPDAPHAAGIHVPCSRPTLSDSLQRVE
mmetsp:Transcript_53008/g.113301  ORF Transcript_53008/g.113301 Transcript_53008/m.113301 type:complete len:230 (-) Transcript_53008:213-902(-)